MAKIFTVLNERFIVTKSADEEFGIQENDVITSFLYENESYNIFKNDSIECEELDGQLLTYAAQAYVSYLIECELKAVVNLKCSNYDVLVYRLAEIRRYIYEHRQIPTGKEERITEGFIRAFFNMNALVNDALQKCGPKP